MINMINITAHQFAPSLRSNVYDTNQFPFSEKFQIKDQREIDDDDDGLDSLDSLMISKKRSNGNQDIRPITSTIKFVPDLMKIDLDQFKSIPPFDMNSINSLSKLTQFQTHVITHFQKFPEDSSKSAQARKIIHDFRRKILQKNLKESDGNLNQSKSNQDWSESETIDQESNHQPFDRLIYLLDRYTDYCRSINLSPWPIHHLKVGIWIQGDVVSLKTRVVPLRKSVRCYVTSLETVRLKTYHLFDHDCEGDEKMLMSSEVLLETLKQLPITRSTINPFHSNPNQNSHGDHQAFDQLNHSSNKLGNFDRDYILGVLKDQSGDHKLEIALNSIREARRQSQVSQNGYKNSKKFLKPKPDPHLHTLNRYQTFCKSNGIPVFPIESVRVSIWLKESVLCLINEPNEEDEERNSLRYKVSLRTVQVYLSRLEYARLRTEAIFEGEFKSLATNSLYRSQAIIDILESFNPNHQNKFKPQLENQSSQSPEPQSLVTDQSRSTSLPDSQWEEESNSTRPSTCGSSSESNLVQTDQEEGPEEIEKIDLKRRWSSLEIDEISDEESKKDVIHKGHISYILCDEDYSIEEKKIKLESDWKVNPLTFPRSYHDFKNPTKTFIPSFDHFLLSSV